jgi:hypothetical protein
MWISLIRYWRSGSIWQKCERRKSKAFLLRGFLGIKSRSRSKSKSSETKWEKAYRLGCWVWVTAGTIE